MCYVIEQMARYAFQLSCKHTFKLLFVLLRDWFGLVWNWFWTIQILCPYFWVFSNLNVQVILHCLKVLVRYNLLLSIQPYSWIFWIDEWISRGFVINFTCLCSKQDKEAFLIFHEKLLITFHQLGNQKLIKKYEEVGYIWCW